MKEDFPKVSVSKLDTSPSEDIFSGDDDINLDGVCGLHSETQEETNSDTLGQGEAEEEYSEDVGDQEVVLEDRESMVSEATEKIGSLFVEHANKYLIDDPELQNAVIDFYSDFDRLNTELGNVFQDKTPEEVQEAIVGVEHLCESEETFKQFAEDYIESFQSTTERAGSFRRRDERFKQNPNASDVEYQLGAFKESLESQVSDAVFELAEKGYRPFESGMDENVYSREQFIGFYDTEIQIPDLLKESLMEEGFTIYLRDMDDRTQIRISPPGGRRVRSSEWKAVWDQVSHFMSDNVNEAVKSKNVYGYHQEFRDLQDGLKIFVK